MAIYGYTKNYKLIKPQFNTDTWHDYIYDNLDTIDAVMSAIYASGNWKGFWATNTVYTVGDVIIDQSTDTMYKVMVDHTTSEATFAEEFATHPTYYELWSPNNLAESWAIKMDDVVSNTDYSSKAYAISSGLIDSGSAQEWAIKSGTVGTTGEYSAKKYATDAHDDYISMTTNVNVIAVGTNIANVNAVGQSISDVNTVASDISSVNTVAGVSSDVTTVAGISTGVSTVANNSANVTTVATNISDVNTAATNIVAIQDAYNNANTARTMATQAAQSATNSANNATASATSANNSHIWAEGTDAQVQALGGVHSSKVWAEQSTNVNIALTNSPYTTNRILEIPQDIKLELNNGTLTLKAGSKVYVPNGFEQDGVTPKFDVITIESDIQAGGLLDSFTDKWVFGYRNNGFYWELLSHCFSGSTFSTQTGENRLGYNTTLNKFQRSINGGAYIDDICSFPICIFSTTSGAITSIDQIFNGFGYIGSTMFALPGIKLRSPDGKNSNGTYKTVERTINNVKTYNAGDWTTRNLNIFISGSESSPIFECQEVERFTYNKKFSSDSSTYSYDENTGIWWYSSNQSSWVTFYGNIVGTCRVESGRITQFQVETVDSVVNSNASNFSQVGRSYLSGLGYPSDRYIDLTLGASGSSYTAPANGYFLVYVYNSGNTYTYARIRNMTTGFERFNPSYGTTSNISIVDYTAHKGEVVRIDYTAQNVNFLRFYYAEGEN